MGWLHSWTQEKNVSEFEIFSEQIIGTESYQNAILLNELLLICQLFIDQSSCWDTSWYGAAKILISYLDILRSVENYSRVIWDISGF